MENSKEEKILTLLLMVSLIPMISFDVNTFDRATFIPNICMTDRSK